MALGQKFRIEAAVRTVRTAIWDVNVNHGEAAELAEHELG